VLFLLYYWICCKPNIMLPVRVSYKYIQNSTVPNGKCFSFGGVYVPAVDV